MIENVGIQIVKKFDGQKIECDGIFVLSIGEAIIFGDMKDDYDLH